MFVMRGSESEDQDKYVNKMIELFRPDSPDCLTLCWHGIRVGETTLDEVEQIVRADPGFTKVERGDRFIQWQAADEPQISIVASHVFGRPGQQIDDLAVNASLVLYQAIKIWGRPIGQLVHVCPGGDSLHGEDIIYFKGSLRVTASGLGLFGYINAPDSPGIYLEPDSPISLIIFFSPTDDLTPSEKYLQRWRGYRSWEVEDVAMFGSCGM